MFKLVSLVYRMEQAYYRVMLRPSK